MNKTDCVCCDAGKGVRTDFFTTRRTPLREQFGLWRSHVASLFDVKTDRAPEAGFEGSARGYDLGDMRLLSCTMDAVSYERSEMHLRRYPMDYWSISVLRRGSDISRSGARIVRAEPGMVQVRSLARSFSGQATARSSVYLFVPRNDFPGLADALDGADHSALGGGMTHVLRDCLLGLERNLRDMQVSELPLVVSTLSQLISAAIRPDAETLAAAHLPVAIARFEQARRLIEDNLSSPELEPRWLCRQLGVSRRQLYYLFEQHGGVSKFILQRRLSACCRAIADQNDHRLISTVAYDFGFSDPAVFSRQFHAEFGFRPSEARSARLAGHMPVTRCPVSFSDWLLQVREHIPEQRAA